MRWHSMALASVLRLRLHSRLSTLRNFSSSTINMTGKHTALFINERDGPFELGSRSTPKPGKGEVLLKVLSAGLNPADWKIQTGILPIVEKYPVILGSDVSGEVVELGEGVTELSKGDKVVYQSWMNALDEAGYQQYLIAKTDIVAVLPHSISLDEAATLPTGIATATVGLYSPNAAALTPPWTSAGKGKYHGESIVVFGGSSVVGQYVIQFARLSGFSTIVTTASAKNEKLVKSLGATHAIDRSGNVVAAIKSALPGGATSLVFDAISFGETPEQAVKVSKPNAKLAFTLPTPDLEVGGRKVLNFFGNAHPNRDVSIPLYKALPELLSSGALKTVSPEYASGGLGGIPAALDKLKAGQVSGHKLVVHPQE